MKHEQKGASPCDVERQRFRDRLHRQAKPKQKTHQGRSVPELLSHLRVLSDGSGSELRGNTFSVEIPLSPQSPVLGTSSLPPFHPKQPSPNARPLFAKRTSLTAHLTRGGVGNPNYKKYRFLSLSISKFFPSLAFSVQPSLPSPTPLCAELRDLCDPLVFLRVLMHNASNCISGVSAFLCTYMHLTSSNRKTHRNTSIRLSFWD